MRLCVIDRKAVTFTLENEAKIIEWSENSDKKEAIIHNSTEKHVVISKIYVILGANTKLSKNDTSTIDLFFFDPPVSNLVLAPSDSITIKMKVNPYYFLCSSRDCTMKLNIFLYDPDFKQQKEALETLPIHIKSRQTEKFVFSLNFIYIIAFVFLPFFLLKSNTEFLSFNFFLFMFAFIIGFSVYCFDKPSLFFTIVKLLNVTFRRR